MKDKKRTTIAYENAIARIVTKTPDFSTEKRTVILKSDVITTVDGIQVSAISLSHDKSHLCVVSDLFDIRPLKIESKLHFFDNGNSNEGYDVYILGEKLLPGRNIFANLLQKLKATNN